MSIFKNRTGTDLWIEDEVGSRRFIKAEAQITASNFFKRYTETGGAQYPVLDVIVDDGIPYAPTQIPNYLKSWALSIESGQDWVDNTIDFTSSTIFSKEALFLQIMVDDAAVEVRLNGLPDSDFVVDAGSTQIFNTGEFLTSQIAFRLPSITGGLPASVRLLAATVRKA